MHKILREKIEMWDGIESEEYSRIISLDKVKQGDNKAWKLLESLCYHSCWVYAHLRMEQSQIDDSISAMMEKIYRTKHNFESIGHIVRWSVNYFKREYLKTVTRKRTMYVETSLMERTMEIEEEIYDDEVIANAELRRKQCVEAVREVIPYLREDKQARWKTFVKTSLEAGNEELLRRMGWNRKTNRAGSIRTREAVAAEVRRLIENRSSNSKLDESKESEIRKAIRLLPPTQRKVLKMGLCGFKRKDMMTSYNLSAETLKVYEFKVRRTLRSLFGADAMSQHSTFTANLQMIPPNAAVLISEEIESLESSTTKSRERLNPAVTQQIVELRDGKKMTFREIGEMLGLSEESAGMRYKRSKRTKRKREVMIEHHTVQ